MHRLLPLLAPLIVAGACTPATITFDETPDPGPADTAGLDTADTGADEPTEDISELSFSLHAEHGSLVYATWTQSVAATTHVEYSFDSGDWLSSPPFDAEPGDHEQLLLGIPYGIDFTLRVAHQGVDGPVYSEEIAGETDNLDLDVPEPILVDSDPDQHDPASRWMFTTMNGSTGYGYLGDDYWAFIFDRQGRVVWAHALPRDRVAIHSRVSQDGTDLLIDHNSYWAEWDNGYNSTIERMKIDGTVVESHPVPGLHHPFTDLADGSIAWGVMDYPDETLEILSPDGQQTSIWSCSGLHREVGENSYCGSNTLYWNEDTDTFLFSFYSTDSVVEVDRQSGETVRTFGHLRGAWEFDPPQSAFWWQHGPNITANGTLLISSKDQSGGSETVVREYTIDEGSETLTEVWSFGEGEGVYGAEMGEAHRLANGNTLHNYGSNARMREVTPAGEVVWDVAWSGSRYLGRSTFIEDLYALAPQ